MNREDNISDRSNGSRVQEYYREKPVYSDLQDQTNPGSPLTMGGLYDAVPSENYEDLLDRGTLVKLAIVTVLAVAVAVVLYLVLRRSRFIARCGVA